MFKKGDTIYILDNGKWLHDQKITILSRTFDHYLNDEQSYLKFSGDSSLTIATWAVSKSIEEATKFAVAYLITKYELNENTDGIDFQEKYKELEKTNADMIFKYMDKVKEA